MIYQTRGSVSFDFQTPRSGLKKRGSSEVFVNQLRGVLEIG